MRRLILALLPIASACFGQATSGLLAPIGVAGTPFPVSLYGAKCSGSTDDSTALQAAITAAAVAGGNVIIPSATCNFATTLTRPRNVMIVGQGRNSSYLNYTGSTRAFVLGDTGANNPPSWKGGFQHLTLEGPSATGSTVGLYMGADPAGVISPTGTLDDDEEWIDFTVKGFGIGATVNNNTYLLSAIDYLFTNNGQHWKDISTNSNAGERMSFESGIFGQSQSSSAPAIELDNNLGDYYITNSSIDYNNISQPDIACLAGNMHVTLTNVHMEKAHGERIHINNTVCNGEVHIFGGEMTTTGTGTTDADMIGLSGSFTSQNVVSVVGTAVNSNETLTQFVDANNPSRQITLDSLAWENYGNLSVGVNTHGNPLGITIRNTQGLTSVIGDASTAFSYTPTVPTASIATNNTNVATTAAVTTALSSYAPLASPTFTGTPKAPAFFPQTILAGPAFNYFDDFLTGANNASNNIGSPTSASCVVNTTYADINHPGQILLTSGTGGSGTGITCGTQSEFGSFISPNSSSSGWTWETAVYVPVLPGTTAGAYQAGLSGSPSANPWTGGIEFYLSSANSVANDWYCRYNTTPTDSTIAATAAAWTRMTMVNDGTYVHWYINGTEATGCKTAVGSMPSGPQYPASWSAVALSSTSVTMAVDYVAVQRSVSR